MAELTEETVVDQITVDEYGNVLVRESTRVLRDGVVIGQTYHRRPVEPDADLTREDARVRAITQEARRQTWRERPPTPDREPRVHDLQEPPVDSTGR